MCRTSCANRPAHIHCEPGSVLPGTAPQAGRLRVATWRLGEHVGSDRRMAWDGFCAMCAGRAPDACRISASGYRWSLRSPASQAPAPPTASLSCGGCTACMVSVLRCQSPSDLPDRRHSGRPKMVPAVSSPGSCPRESPPGACCARAGGAKCVACVSGPGVPSVAPSPHTGTYSPSRRGTPTGLATWPACPVAKLGPSVTALPAETAGPVRMADMPGRCAPRQVTLGGRDLPCFLSCDASSDLHTSASTPASARTTCSPFRQRAT